MKDIELESVFSAKSKQLYPHGHIILRATDNPDSLYYLVRGFVRQYAVSDKGEILSMHLFRPGACFPLTWLLNKTPNRFVYEAVGNVVVQKIPEKEVLQLLESNPALSFSFLKKILLGLDGLQFRMELLVFGDARQTILGLLEYLSKVAGKKIADGMMIDIPLTHKDVASWIGTTRETASLQLEKLKKQGIIRMQKKHIYIPVIEKLRGS